MSCGSAATPPPQTACTPDHLTANSIVPFVFDRDRHIVGGRGPQSHGLTNHLHINKGPSGKTEPACRKDEGR